MANKRLSKEEIAQMKHMVLDGVSPEDMSKHFNIAISSVHNYKKRFKDEGLSFPMIRGQRPTGDINPPKRDLMKELDQVERKANHMVNNSDSMLEAVSSMNNNNEVSDYKFFVNGKLIEIKGDISNIILKKNSIEIIV